MAIHDWKTAPAGFFHHFHQRGACAICDALNAGRLPSGYFALIEKTTFGVAPDVVTLQGWRPPRRPANVAARSHWRMPRPGLGSPVESTDEEAYAARANRIAVRDSSHEVVAVIEIVSPGNKSSRNAMKSFVEKAIDLLRQGVNLLIIDLFPPTPRDLQGIHQKIWSELADEPFVLPADKPLTLAAYTAGVPLRAFVEPVAVGDPSARDAAVPRRGQLRPDPARRVLSGDVEHLSGGVPRADYGPFADGLGPGAKILLEIPRHELPQVQRRVVPLADRVRAVGIGHHRERLVVADQLVDQGLGPLVVAVVVARPVDDQQVPLELVGEGDRRALR